MDHKEQSAADERITTLALEVQAHCFDYFDGKLSGQEWLQLVVDAVQTHQAEAQPSPEEQERILAQESEGEQWGRPRNFDDSPVDLPYTDDDLREQYQIRKEWEAYAHEGDESPPRPEDLRPGGLYSPSKEVRA